jgi:membrane fusion protein (multidrug efflux system)
MKKIIYLIAAIIIIVALILIKILLIDDSAPAPAVAQKAKQIPTDIFVVKDTVPVFDVNVMGTVKAVEQVDIVGELNRKITSINFKEGSYVSKNSLLFKLDDREILAELDQLKHEKELADETLKRNKALFETGGASAQLIDESETKLNVITAKINYLETILDKTEIKAPFSGMIGIRYVSPGALIDPGMTLATLYDISNVYIDFAIPEKYATGDLSNREISFSTLATNEVFKARVTAIQPNIDRDTRTLMLRAIAANSDKKLMPGSSVRVDLAVGEMQESIFVPTNSLLPTMKGYSIYVLKNGIAEEVNVDIGMRNNESAQVLSGLNIGDSIITTNLLRIIPGAAVSVANVIK